MDNSTTPQDSAAMSPVSTGSLASIGPVVRKPAAYIVYVDGIGSIMPLCRDMVEVDGLRSRFADRVRKVVPLYAWNEWDEIRKAGDRLTREEGFKVMEMELNALHAENARLRWRLAAAEIRQVASELMEDAAREIERLRSLTRFQDNVIRSGDAATLTDSEREALEWASSSHEDMARLQGSLKSLLERFPKHDAR